MAATLKMTKHHWRMRQRERECSNDENAAGPAYFVIRHPSFVIFPQCFIGLAQD
jgi:hypothetical protein